MFGLLQVKPNDIKAVRNKISHGYSVTFIVTCVCMLCMYLFNVCVCVCVYIYIYIYIVHKRNTDIAYVKVSTVCVFV